MRDILAIPFALLGWVFQSLSNACDAIVEFIADDNPQDPAMKD